MNDPKNLFEVILNKEMKDLIGTRNWNMWKKLEPEMYSAILMAMFKYGKYTWANSQLSQNMFRRRFKTKQPSAVITPFKP